MNIKRNIVFILVAAFALIVDGCAAQSGIYATTTPTVQPSSTPVPTSTMPAATETPSGIPSTNALVVTLQNDGQTIHLKNGQSFLLKLGVDDSWTVTLSDPSVVSRIPNILVIRGAQGVYLAHKPGTTTMTAVGKPVCNPGEVCPMLEIAFRVTLVVS